MEWHHAPLHRLGAEGAYCVTAATHLKEHFFASRARLDLLNERLFELAERHRWRLQAWAFFPNHYHFVAVSPERGAMSLRTMIRDFHSATAREVNQRDDARGRQVWFQFWETRLTYHGSYLARLRYVQENAVHHGIVESAENYRWCSARWFAEHADGPFAHAVRNVKIDAVRMKEIEFGGSAALLK